VADTNVAEPAERVTGPEADSPVDCGSQTANGELLATAPVAVVPADEGIPSLPAELALGSEVLSVANPAFGERSQQQVDDCDVVGPMPQMLEGTAAISTVIDQNADVIGSRVAAPMLRDPALAAACESPTLELPKEKPQDLPIMAQALPTPFESKQERRLSKAAAESVIGGSIEAARGECAAARDVAFASLDVRPKARRQGGR
jgi:hypothetical protein